MADSDWNPELYQTSHSFVWQYGRELLALLAPQRVERILDAGCGTGQLTAEIARSGAEVVGIDSSPTMLEQARKNYPDLHFELADVAALEYREEFDGVFSNAALHWVKDAGAAVASISRALKPGGRMVAEFGGRGNVQRLLDAAGLALESLGIRAAGSLNPWYFPSIAEYASLLERNGLAVTYAALFDRMTPLEGGEEGIASWLAMFGGPFRDSLGAGQWEEFVRRTKQHAAPHLLREGQWLADYRRIRVVAIR